jgi:hypothetical protein
MVDLINGRLAILSMMNSARVESPVGIKSCEKIILFGGVQDSTSHCFHDFPFSSI